MGVLAHRRNPNVGRLRRVARGVGEEVVQHLHDAPPVGHHPGKVRRKVDQHAVAPAAAEERAPRALHQLGHLRRLGRDRERARLDAPGVEQVADEPAHVVGLLDDEAVELAHLRRVEPRRLVEQRHRRALDGGERRAKLVAHQAQKLGAQPLHLVERRKVLHGHHHRADGVAFGGDGRRVDQRPDAAPVRHREHHFLGAHRLAAVELLGEGELAQRHLAPVGAAKRQHLKELPGRMAGRAQALHDAPRLAVERHRLAALRIEHHHPHRRGLDQGLEVGPRAPLAAVGARVGDRRRGLGCEQRQHLLVLVGERFPVGLLGEEEVADIDAPVVQQRALGRCGRSSRGRRCRARGRRPGSRPRAPAPAGCADARTAGRCRARRAGPAPAPA